MKQSHQDTDTSTLINFFKNELFEHNHTYQSRVVSNNNTCRTPDTLLIRGVVADAKCFTGMFMQSIIQRLIVFVFYFLFFIFYIRIYIMV